jgi:hypothetical protein
LCFIKGKLMLNARDRRNQSLGEVANPSSAVSQNSPRGYVSGETDAFARFLRKCHERRTNSRDDNFLPAGSHKKKAGQKASPGKGNHE